MNSKQGEERKEHPSRWPVYVMCGVVVILSIGQVGFPWGTSEVVRLMSGPDVYQTLHPWMQRWVDFHQWIRPYAPVVAAVGVFGLIGGVGAAMFRPWGWWCVAVWTALLVMFWALRCVYIGATTPLCAGAIIPWVALILWPLIARRGLLLQGHEEGEA